MKEYHVGHEPDGTWHVQRENAERPLAFYNTIDAAESAARVLAQLAEGIVVVHESKGGVRRTDYRGRVVPLN